MNKGTKIVIGTGLGIGALLLVLKGGSLLNFTKQLTCTPKIDGGIKRISVKNSKLQIPVAVDFENRTDQEVTISISNVVLKYNNTEVGTLKPNTQSILIQKYKTSTLSNIIVEIPLLTLVRCIGSAVTTYLTTQDYTKILEYITADITCILNNSVVFDFTEKFGEASKVDVSKNTKAVSGIGLVANTKRKLKPFKDYEMLIPAKSELLHRDLIMVPNGSVYDTVNLVKDICKKYASDTKVLAKHLQKDNLHDTIQSIFDFVYNYIQYEPDDRFIEQVRRPLRTLWDRKGDCDCFATLIGSILTNLNIPFKFRIAAYEGRRNFQHIYVIVPTGAGEYCVCDPVLDTCFTEKTPSKYLDF
ncbi:MAG: hypothetical protein MJ197_03595 [Bacteroidales bacterium]|nr:hypothetical protein [Bacteroidales bacterium]